MSRMTAIAMNKYERAVLRRALEEFLRRERDPRLRASAQNLLEMTDGAPSPEFWRTLPVEWEREPA